MAVLSSSCRWLSDISNCACPQINPTDLCGVWTYEYKSAYSPHGNQYMQEVYMLLSTGLAYRSTIDKYDEGNHYFSERKTSGWGSWFVDAEEKVIITCSTVMNSQLGGSVCGDEKPSWTENKAISSQSKFRRSWVDFIHKYTRQGSLDDIEEEKLCTQMRLALESLPPTAKPPAEEDCARETLLPVTPPCQDCCDSNASRRPVQKAGALCGLRRMFSRSRRQRM